MDTGESLFSAIVLLLIGWVGIQCLKGAVGYIRETLGLPEPEPEEPMTPNEWKSIVAIFGSLAAVSVPGAAVVPGSILTWEAVKRMPQFLRWLGASAETRKSKTRRLAELRQAWLADQDMIRLLGLCEDQQEALLEMARDKFQRGAEEIIQL
jgi:hypothetical protein